MGGKRMQDLLALLSGGIVGFTLGLIGGGGSILAVPLLLYVVGMADPHVVIGTTSVAVAANAATALWPHAQAGNVRWPVAGVFSAFGVAGAAIGSGFGKAFDGQKLLLLFALLMLVIAMLMLMLRRRGPVLGGRFVLSGKGVAKLAGVGGCVGGLAGFFGIGGGFLIVPGLILATGIPMLQAVGTSLVSVTAFGLTTAASYALSGLVDWPVAGLFVIGGLGGGLLGSRLAGRLAARRQALAQVFAGVIAVVAVYMMVRGIMALSG